MNIIVPMAGMGKRMRPHTLTTPKPLVPVAGKPIVQRLVEDIAALVVGQSHHEDGKKDTVDEIAYIIHRAFGAKAEADLVAVAEKLGARGTIHYQDEPLGTAHAILCARTALKGEVVVAFADTLFRADFQMQPGLDGTIWVSRIEDPRQFGVVKTDGEGIITDFIEKPQEFVSDLAIIGIYHFADGERLERELQYLIDNDLKEKGEFQLTNALENMKRDGLRFGVGKVDAWLDCGNKDATVAANANVLDHLPTEGMVHESLVTRNAMVISPCFIGPNVTLEDCIVGPHVSLGEGVFVTRSVVTNSIIGASARLTDTRVDNSMVGVAAVVDGKPLHLSLSDYSTVG